MKFLLLKRIESIFLFFAIALFALPSFAVDSVIMCTGSSISPVCPAGLKPVQIYLPFGVTYKCFCVGATADTTCSARSTLVKRPIPITSSYSISCGTLKYFRDVAGGWSNTTLYSNNPASTLRVCWTILSLNRSDLTNTRYCGLTNHTRRGHIVEVGAWVSCPANTNNDQECRNTLTNMVEGKATFPERPSVLDRSSCCGDKNSCYAINFLNPRVRLSSGAYPRYTCLKALKNRINGNFLPLISDRVILYTNAIGGMMGETQPMWDMQCIADNIKFRNVCECNNGDYEFDVKDVLDTCVCPGGSPKAADGTCPSGVLSCPADSILKDDGNCYCLCKNGNQDVHVATTDTCDAPSTCAPTTPIINPKCPNEVNWNHPPGPSPIHPWVTGPTPTGAICNNAKRCPDGGLVREDPLGVDYCYSEQICSEDEIIKKEDCTDSTQSTDYGACKATPSSINHLCPNPSDPLACEMLGRYTGITEFGAVGLGFECIDSNGNTVPSESPPYEQPSNFHATSTVFMRISACPFGSTMRFTDSNVMEKGKCVWPFNPTSVYMPGVEEFDCNEPGTTVFMSRTEMTNSSLSGYQISAVDPQWYPTCYCMSGLAGPSTEYTCDQGVPSSQDASCRCQVSTSEKACPADEPDGRWYKQSSSLPGNCDCPDATWTKNGNTCSKNSTSSSLNGSIMLEYAAYLGETDPNIIGLINASASFNQNYFPPPGVLSTLGAARADGFTCQEAFQVAGTHTSYYVCVKSVPIKSCTEGGAYNSVTDECEMPCVQQNNVTSCECVKKGDPCGCAVGWTQVGTECHKPALPCSPQICTCKCYTPAQIEYLDFDPEDQVPGSINQLIRNDILANPTNPTICTDIVPTDPNKCGDRSPPCCRISTNTCFDWGNCPVLNPSTDPDYKLGCCPTCPDGNPIPVPPSCPNGGCCANGMAKCDIDNCPSTGSHIGGDPRGIDIAFGSQGVSSFYSVYSTGSMDRPDYICWRRDTAGTTKVQMRELMCPPEDDCGGGTRDLSTQMCQCQSLNASDEIISHDETYCEYASRDPMRFEEGIIKGDVPSSRGNDKYETGIRSFKTNLVVTPGR